MIWRFFASAGFFVLFLISGLFALRFGGGTTGDGLHDAYRLLAMFALAAEWAVAEDVHPFVRFLAFLAPAVAILGIVELLSRSFFDRIRRGVRLRGMRAHIVVFGLTPESLLLVRGIRRSTDRKKVVMVGQVPSQVERHTLQNLGVVHLEEECPLDEALALARAERADVLIAFMPGADESLTLLFGLNGYLSRKGRMAGRDPIDLWMKTDNPNLGDRLAEYFGMMDLQDRLHPRFFSLEETAARRLWRQHPLDSLAEAQGHSDVHLAVYGFDRLASQVITEAVRQTLVPSGVRMKVTVLTDQPEEARRLAEAWRPGLFACVDLTFTAMPFVDGGVSNADYDLLPDGATAHIVCHGEPERAVATALSLRRLLLQAPAGIERRARRRLNAPIFARFDRPGGIGELLNTVDTIGLRKTSGWPDGVEVFGGYDDMLAEDMQNAQEPTVIDTAREAIARTIHLSYQEGIAESRDRTPTTEHLRRAERSWQVLAPEFRDSCRHAADHLWSKARALGGRIEVSGTGSHHALHLEPDAVRQLSEIEHQRWVHERLLAGWSYAEKRVDAARRHPLLRPYSELPPERRSIDRTLVTRMDLALSAGNLAFRREHRIGITGHRWLGSRSFDEAAVYQVIRNHIAEIAEKAGPAKAVLYTALATGADSLAAEAARSLGVPFIAVLPIPFEAARADYEAVPDGVARFLELIADAERVIELPLLFGDLTDIALDNEGRSAERDRQYALAGGYIARRAQTMIAVWDGQPARGFGGTGTIVQWRNEGGVPDAYALGSRFTPSYEGGPLIVVPPVPAAADTWSPVPRKVSGS
jgi:hypothetical protein